MAGSGSGSGGSGSGGGGGGGSGGGGGGGGTSTACAACKYQRRKCTPDCPLSPYFPPDQPKRFQNVHKLFGVSNILRILKHVDPSKREDTVKSIAYEADTREKDPVHGCLGVITILQNQVSKLKGELAVAREQLYLLQQQHNFNQQAQMQEIVGSLGGSTAMVSVSSAQETNVLMQHLQQYNDITQLSSDFAKSNPLPISSFEPDQYLRNDSFDPKPGSASTSRFDVGRYIRGESPVSHQPVSPGGLLGSVKEEQQQADHLHYGSSMQHYGRSFSASDHHNPLHQLQQDLDHASFDAPSPYATAIRSRASGGLLNLTVASEAELRRASGHVPEHELRSAGVYLTLTNN